jgi:hypothetical protein
MDDRSYAVFHLSGCIFRPNARGANDLYDGRASHAFTESRTVLNVRDGDIATHGTQIIGTVLTSNDGSYRCTMAAELAYRRPSNLSGRT